MLQLRLCRLYILFQSTLPREERRCRLSALLLLCHFNPRSHERSDLKPHVTVNQAAKFQSTLPREERPSCGSRWGAGVNFNPRSHERSDKVSTAICRVVCHFNPRSHERSDPVGSCQTHYCQHFNPRSHERSDKLYRIAWCQFVVFQSTLPREERQCREYAEIAAELISIHAPTRGATSMCILSPPTLHISIHAPTRGATK